MLNPRVKQRAPQEIWCKPCDTEARASEENAFLFVKIKIIKMRNSKTISDSVCLGPEAAGSWGTQGKCHSGTDPTSPGTAPNQQGTHRLSGQVLAQAARLCQAHRGKALREKDTNLRPDLKIWFKFPSSEKKRQNKCPSVIVLFLLEKSLGFFLRNKSVW